MTHTHIWLEVISFDVGNPLESLQIQNMDIIAELLTSLTFLPSKHNHEVFKQCGCMTIPTSWQCG